MLEIKDLHVTVSEHEIIKGLNLSVQPGEVHAIMGPNGSGKSTFGYTLAGRDGYAPNKGTVEYLGADLLAMDVDERARAGIFLGFQYPVEIPGVSNIHLLRESYNRIQKQRGGSEVDAIDFLAIVKKHAAKLGLDPTFMHRGVNEQFSGGEKKRNEILQMAVLEPKLAILDETDSGLDIDAMRVVSSAINDMRDKERSFILVTQLSALVAVYSSRFCPCAFRRQDRLFWR